jgi:hypothetical protein
MWRSGSIVMTPPTLPAPVPGALAVITTGLLGRGRPVAMSMAWRRWTYAPLSLVFAVNQIVFAARSITGVAVMPISGVSRPQPVSCAGTDGPKLFCQSGGALGRRSSASNA